MSVTRLASLSGYARSSIGRVIYNQRTCPVQFITDISLVLNISPCWLAFGIGEMSRDDRISLEAAAERAVTPWQRKKANENLGHYWGLSTLKRTEDAPLA